MATYNNGGFFNPAYHDSDTLEIDRRSSSKTNHINPYAREGPALSGERPEWRHDAALGAPRGGWEDASGRGRESIPMDLITTRPGSPSWQHNLDQSTFQIDPDSQHDQLPSVRLPSSVTGNMTMRWRGISMRRMSMFPNADPARAAFTEVAIRSEMENEEQQLVKELVALSTRDQIQAMRDLPMSFEAKKHVSDLLAQEAFMLMTSKKEILMSDNEPVNDKLQKPAHLIYGAKYRHSCPPKDLASSHVLQNALKTYHWCGYSVRSARQTLELWHGTMKDIGGKFGSSVLTYFVFLKWLLFFNIFSFLVNFGFITIPLLVHNPLPNIPSNVSFRGLELLTGVGYFNYTVMYYGGYSNETLRGLVEYDMQLAYFFTIAVYMLLCGVTLIFSMASSFKKNYVLVDPASHSSWQLLCSWDFSVTNEKAVRQRKSNLGVQLKESLSDKAQREQLTCSKKLSYFGVNLGTWVLSTSLAVGCGASIFYLCQYEEQRTSDSASWSLQQEAETLLIPFVVSLMNLVIPLFYSFFNNFEHYSSQRRQVYVLVIRNVHLRMSILGALCYYWMNVMPQKYSCWESMVGQALYRLVIVDFLFLMLGSFIGEFLHNVIGTKIQPRLGLPEFDIARNVLELINAQTLAWIGIYFSPLLPAIQILKFFILFYLKKVSLTRNCQPPRRSGRAAQMQTIFIFLLFFPFFVGALSIVAFTSWSLTPSEQCGPFRGLNNTFSVVGVWIDHLENIPGSQWVVWIYENVIRSEIFYFLITIIILVIIYIFWQITRGRKKLILLLRQQIVNEEKDKSFLLDKLQNLQKSHPKYPKQTKQRAHTNSHSDDHSSGGQSTSNAMVQALLARQQFAEEEERFSIGGVPGPSDISTSSALMQAMLARQRAERENEEFHQRPEEHPLSHSAFAQAMAARQRAEGEERNEYYSTTNFSENRSSAVTQAMHARLKAEKDEENDSYDLPSPVSSTVIQVMEARRKAEQEDGIQWVSALSQTQAPPQSSALIQAMLARQQAQNEYDDGY